MWMQWSKSMVSFVDGRCRRCSRPTTLTDTRRASSGPQWANTTVLSGDVAAAVGELRAEPGGELQVWGSATLIRWLLHHRLVDEIVLLT
jgi:dihydrofolate reductase